MRLLLKTVVALTAVMAAAPSVARAQAYVDDPNSLSATFGYTYAPSGKIVADSTKSTFSDGFESTQPNMVVLAHMMDFAAQYVTPVKGLALELDVPFVGIKASKSSFMHEPQPGPYDDGQYHWTVTDIRGGVRYQVKQIEQYLGLAFVLAGSVPTDYPTMGLTAPGQGLKALYMGASVARTFDPWSPNLYFQADYEFALRERVDVDAATKRFNRNYSNVNVALGYFLPDGFSVDLAATSRKAHGGVDFKTIEFEPYSVLLYHDRLLREDWLLAGGDLGYSVNDQLQLTAGARFFVVGENTRNMNLFGFNANYRFF